MPPPQQSASGSAPTAGAAAAAPAPPPEKPRPRVGMGVLIEEAGTGRICMGQRLNSLGHGEWALPGGHLEHGEAFEECARREVEEETGLVIGGVRLVAVENVVFDSGHHYVVLFMHGTAPAGSAPEVLEPTKCAQWAWVTWDELRALTPVFRPLRQLLDRGFRLGGGGGALGS
ncbi:hypothetical protein Rsub_12741 [Raphidocelis subcapitata]|uniref:Nudix hydrolase domain-containing protein n=1 Tax=Raphidocelis subcapitata TaxID=307507 RepID=A0A2V0PKQ5_9CHLO|nr:hypothetical protein Rsub_12741 [Raphidocelis subcapitata]|eukprot:GBG00130.1 hypothetical protein Rsub_12741 [Raphidocelis subcapitata]